MKLFLDDLRYPKEVKWIDIGLGPWEIVRSYDEFVKFILKIARYTLWLGSQASK